MFSRSPSAIPPERLDLLDSNLAVSYFRRLLWAEGFTLGISKDLIQVPTKINVADGGIDAEVSSESREFLHGIIKPGANYYQVKTGPFDPRRSNNINKLLFTPESLRKRKRELHPRVKECLDRGGRFVVVLFGWDNPKRSGPNPAERIRSVLCSIDGRYADALIDVWHPNQLIGCFEAHLSLALDINGLAGESFITHATWSSWETMSHVYHAGEDQRTQIEAIQRSLRTAVEPACIRVTGEPGIGKTRLVLEATNVDDLRPGVVYYESPDRLWQGGVFPRLVRADSELSAILIVDECGATDGARLWDQLKHAGHRVKLITIHADESDTAGGDLRRVSVARLPQEETTLIIQRYIQEPFEANRWATLCEGSPRVAHAVGESLQRNPGDIFQPASLNLVWKRYLSVESANQNSDQRLRLRVLQYLALFKRFGYLGQVAGEARAIFELIESNNRSLTWDGFRDIVGDLRRRRILQGERTLYISPRLCHIWLWAGWWENYGSNERLDDLTSRLPSSLVDWFWDMFEYAAMSDVAASTVRGLLSRAGPFEGQALLEQPSLAKLLRILSNADPAFTLQLLQRVMSAWTDDQLRELAAGPRQELVWTLEALALRGELFADAARLVLRLADTDSEPLRNE